ncbi:single-stranded-DNA-specific exonuclease RecJ [Desulfurivibrio alkaliphilus]|uniref:Single-stranded-DNA-specific exonuclease RecJ n=1 Tax=Desulfurivibrio alkaliphilus (strain DSM 19089 / UNIQEM U267 / AHT2) TaxID=589865 RepID=D6Z1S9_DESAT|nr:single-stranded-DNA-specific exonuclease RecJ [Desulfurivibrio alkaliphilus]ADH85504.1 single-stranded-DNA-specific exonuclease RecJ [Desulfurivibrio alkaliphilus AHT 2]
MKYQSAGGERKGERGQVDLSCCKSLALDLGLPEALVAVLLRRGHRDRAGIESFLRPNLADLPDPDLMLGMSRAVELIANSMGSRQPIVVYADYDVDGLSAGAVLYKFLENLNCRDLYYLLPHRGEDGYGVHAHLLAELRAKLGGNARPLLITVDCGIGDHQALIEARELGYTVIVTDHHRPEDTLPPAAAILNPHQAGCPFPCKNLAGVGVAFYLMMGLRRHLAGQGFFADQPPVNLKEYMDLVALGTVADMVALRGANRILVRAGLEVMQESRRPGLVALAVAAGIKPPKGEGSEKRAIYPEDISFSLAPRLNAAGRVATPETAFRLLITDNPAEAQALAAELEELNRWRRQLSDQVYRQAKERAAASEQQKMQVLVLADENWHTGVLGIAATRLQQDFNRPVILFGYESPNILRGSGRSFEGLDLLAMVDACSELLLGYGGHAAALGVTLDPGRLAEFQAQLNEAAGRIMAERQPEPTITVDWHFADGRIDAGLTTNYHLLEPFGPGNPEPLFQVKGPLAQAGVVGREQNHLRFRWQQKDFNLPGIAFNYGNSLKPSNPGPVELIFALRRNIYQGRVAWQLQAKSIKPTS